MLHPATLHRQLCCLPIPMATSDQRSTRKLRPGPVCAFVRVCQSPASRLPVAREPPARLPHAFHTSGTPTADSRQAPPCQDSGISKDDFTHAINQSFVPGDLADSLN
jgi:hypothetical protein